VRLLTALVINSYDTTCKKENLCVVFEHQKDIYFILNHCSIICTRTKIPSDEEPKLNHCSIICTRTKIPSDEEHKLNHCSIICTRTKIPSDEEHKLNHCSIICYMY
jgi:hypothetical protein